MSPVRAGRLVPLGLALGLVWQSTAQAEGAQAQAVELTWSAPVSLGCPDADYALAELRRYVGSGRQLQRPIQARVVVQRGGGGDLRLILRTEQANSQGERTLRDASCAALVDAAVVILAWMVDPQKMAARATTAAPSPAEPAAPAPQTPPTAVSATHPRRELEPFLDLGLPLDVGTLPRAALGGEARAGIALIPLRWAVYGAYWPAVERTLGALADGRAVGGTFTLLAFGVQSCLETPLGVGAARLRLGACVGPELDLMRGESFGVNRGGTGQKAWLAAVGEVNARLRLSGHAWVVLRASSVVPTLRETFALQGVGVVHQPAAAAFRGALGIELQL